MSVLFCSVGRRSKLLIDFKKSQESIRIIATDNSKYAPALYFADKPVIAPRIDDDCYLKFILDLCDESDVKAITTLIDPEIEFLAENRVLLIDKGVLPLCPSLKTAKLCFDKFEMYKYLTLNGIPTVLTYGDLESFENALSCNEISFPVFIKPRSGSASVGAEKIEDLDTLKLKYKDNQKHNYIIQELMVGEDIDADVYVDCLSQKATSAFLKKKIETKIGGASKTISFKDERLFKLIKKIVEAFEFYGPIDMDFFYKDGIYYLSEINPRFGGAYIHAYGAGVDFFKMIVNNINGIENMPDFGSYQDDIVMMMYDDVVIKPLSELA